MSVSWCPAQHVNLSHQPKRRWAASGHVVTPGAAASQAEWFTVPRDFWVAHTDSRTTRWRACAQKVNTRFDPEPSDQAGESSQLSEGPLCWVCWPLLDLPFMDFRLHGQLGNPDVPRHLLAPRIKGGTVEVDRHIVTSRCIFKQNVSSSFLL